jgi:hypothetical protein
MTSRQVLIKKKIEDILGGKNDDLRKAIVSKYTPVLLCKTSGLSDDGLVVWLATLKDNTGKLGLQQAVIDAINL